MEIGVRNIPSGSGDYSVLNVDLAHGVGKGSGTAAPPPPGSSEVDHVTFTFETFVTMMTTVVCVVGNALILVVASWTTAFDNFNRCYLYSMTSADIFLGLFVTPFCIFNTMYGKYVFNSDMFCCVEAYLMTLFVMVSMICMTYMNVDHYVAVRKPDRYGAMMSFNRSLCWIVLTWIIATSFCCPPLFSLQRAFYYREAFICIIDSRYQQAYFMTVMLLVTLPVTIAILITSRYLFTSAFQDQKKFYVKVYEDFSERSWNYVISFVISTLFLVTWLPFTVVRLVEHNSKWRREDIPRELHFFIVWFGVSNCFTKFLVYLLMSRRFRQGLRQVCGLPGRPDYAACQTQCGSAESLSSNNIITDPAHRK